MRATILFAWLVLSSGGNGWLQASSLICQTGGTPAGLVATPCGQTFVANEFMDWGAPSSFGGLGEAVNPPAGLGPSVSAAANPTAGGVASDGIVITSNMTLERADNTAYAWDAALGAWVSPTLVANGVGGNASITTFDGHFDAPDLETASGPYNADGLQHPFGDALLGAVSNAPSNQNAQMTLSFSQELYGLAFQVSNRAGTDSNFIATLSAYDGSGDLIGIYNLNTNGANTGGACPGLLNPATAPYFSDPTPCNDAPVIEFYDPEGHIKSVALTMSDTQGLFIGSMSLGVSTPECGTGLLAGGGLFLCALLALRRRSS